jgi:hypothetical protein
MKEIENTKDYLGLIASFERVELELILRELVSAKILRYKLPWRSEKIKDTEGFVVLDAWGKSVLTCKDQKLATKIINLCAAALKRQKDDFSKDYKKILVIWELLEREDKRKEIMENDYFFRNVPLR